MARVLRHDRGELQRPIRTPQGLRVEGYAGRAGVYRYDAEDGSTRLELRPESEVMHADALAGFEAAPITNGHPGELVANDATLRAKHARGVVLSARRDESRVAITGIITDPETVAAIEGGRRELSPGYTVDVDETPGVDPVHGRYDAIQRHIRIDHLALVTRARGGRDMQLRLDQIRLDGMTRAIHIDAKGCYYADADGKGGVDGCDGEYGDDEREDAELDAAARANVAPQKFAVPGKRKLPIHDKAHVVAAMSRFSQTEGLSGDEKSKAAKRIVNAAKKNDIDPSGFAEKHGVRTDGGTMTTETRIDETTDSIRTERDALKARNDALDARVTSLELQLGQAKGKLADIDSVATKLRAANERADAASGKLATNESTLEARIRKSAELRTKAILLIGPQARVDGLADDDVCRAVLRALTPSEAYDAKTPEWRRARLDELRIARDVVAHEREQIARVVRGDAAPVVHNETKIKHADLWKAGPPATNAMRKRER